MLLLERVRRTSSAVCLLLACVLFTLLLCVLLDQVEFPRLRAPTPPISWARLHPPASSLLDLPNFRYLINNDVCGDSLTIRAVFIVTSHAGDLQARNVHRKVLPFSELHRLKLRRVFLLATATRNQTGYKYISQEQILEENKKCGDLIQGNFQEAYRNLSYKHVMGLQWAVNYCGQAQYIIKMDDDIAMNVYELLRVLAEVRPLGLAGYVLQGLAPERGGVSKWSVSRQEWAADTYPPFLSGWLYVTQPSVVERLLKALDRTRFFWIDDVLVTGVAAERANVSLTSLREHFALHSERLRCCVQGDECGFVVAPSSGDWQLLESYLTLVASRRGDLSHRGEPGHRCVVVQDPDIIPAAAGRPYWQPFRLR